MSNNLFGKVKPIKEIKGEQGVYGEVSVDTPSYLNRKTRASVINKHTTDGFHHSRFSPITVAQTPVGRYVVDGDHRRHMWCQTFPEKDTIPAFIVKVDSLQDVNRLFVEKNKTHKTPIKPEHEFVNEVAAGVEEALKTEKLLKKAALSVSLQTNEKGDTVGSARGKNTADYVITPIKNFINAVREYGGENVIKSSHLLQDSWAKDNKIGGEMLSAIALLFHTYPALAKCPDDGELAGEFYNWFKGIGQYFKQTTQSRNWRKTGGDVRNKQVECISLGILRDFRSHTTGLNFNTYVKNKIAPKKLQILIRT